MKWAGGGRTRVGVESIGSFIDLIIREEDITYLGLFKVVSFYSSYKTTHISHNRNPHNSCIA